MCLYVACIIGLSVVADRSVGDALTIRGEHAGDYALLVNRFTGKAIQFLCVLIPGVALLRWLDRRPGALLGMGCYKQAARELAVGMLLGVSVILLYALMLWSTHTASFTFNGPPLQALLYASACLVVLGISAAYEEVLFRGYVFQSLIEGTSFGFALVFFAVLFGFAHLQNADATPFSIAFATVAGVFLGLLYYRTRGLWMGIGAHCMWNWSIGPVLGIDTSPFLRRTVFTHASLPSGLGSVDAVRDGALALGMLVLTAYLWKAKWLKPAEYNATLWAPYASAGAAPPTETRAPDGSLGRVG